jgi:hypothetical protein
MKQKVSSSYWMLNTCGSVSAVADFALQTHATTNATSLTTRRRAITQQKSCQHGTGCLQGMLLHAGTDASVPQKRLKWRENAALTCSMSAVSTPGVGMIPSAIYTSTAC